MKSLLELVQLPDGSFRWEMKENISVGSLLDAAEGLKNLARNQTLQVLKPEEQEKSEKND